MLKANNEMAKIVSAGSIDDEATNRAACDVLEGAKEAFTRRARISDDAHVLVLAVSLRSRVSAA